jgi:hypothetical protein
MCYQSVREPTRRHRDGQVMVEVDDTVVYTCLEYVFTRSTSVNMVRLYPFSANSILRQSILRLTQYLILRLRSNLPIYSSPVRLPYGSRELSIIRVTSTLSDRSLSFPESSPSTTWISTKPELAPQNFRYTHRRG